MSPTFTTSPNPAFSAETSATRALIPDGASPSTPDAFPAPPHQSGLFSNMGGFDSSWLIGLATDDTKFPRASDTEDEPIQPETRSCFTCWKTIVGSREIAQRGSQEGVRAWGLIYHSHSRSYNRLLLFTTVYIILRVKGPVSHCAINRRCFWVRVPVAAKMIYGPRHPWGSAPARQREDFKPWEVIGDIFDHGTRKTTAQQTA